MQRTGLILISHGTRSTAGTNQFLELAATLGPRLSPICVAPAFLEMQEPTIDAAVGQLLDGGIRQLVTLPLLLFAAGHAKRDIPRQIGAALARRGSQCIKHAQAPHLGCHPALIELSRRRMEESISNRNGSEFTQAFHCPSLALRACLLVGRGSRDESATAEMHEFAQLREQSLRTAKIEVAFLAMARPLLAEKLPELARRGFRQIIVQPHLLFHGDLFDQIEQQVVAAAAEHPEIEWTVAQPLADNAGIVTAASDLLQKVILDRCHEAAIHVVGVRDDD